MDPLSLLLLAAVAAGITAAVRALLHGRGGCCGDCTRCGGCSAGRRTP